MHCVRLSEYVIQRHWQVDVMVLYTNMCKLGKALERHQQVFAVMSQHF